MARMPPVRVDLGGETQRRISLTAYEIITGHGGLAYVVVAGFIAGLLLWVPLFVILLFNQLLVSGSGAHVGVYGGSFQIDMGALAPYMLATGMLGFGLSLLRRLSARIGWYKEIASQRMGLNGAVASILGAVLCIVLIASGSQAGLLLIFISIGVIFGGYIINVLWEVFHNVLLMPYGAGGQRSDRVLQRAIQHELQRQVEIRPTHLERVEVEGGKVTLRATWDSTETRREAEQALRAMTGVASVHLEKMQ